MTKSRFNEIKDVITRVNESKSTTRLGKRYITLKDAEKLIEKVISGKINKKKARSMYNNIPEDVNKLKKINPAECRKKMLPIFEQLQEILMGPKVDNETKVDETKDDETKDGKTDEQPDTTDMPELESEESAAQRREKDLKHYLQKKCFVDYQFL